MIRWLTQRFWPRLNRVRKKWRTDDGNLPICRQFFRAFLCFSWLISLPSQHLFGSPLSLRFKFHITIQASLIVLSHSRCVEPICEKRRNLRTDVSCVFVFFVVVAAL